MSAILDSAESVNNICPRCGAGASGRFCGDCGERVGPGRSYLAFMDAFLKISQWKEWTVMFARLLRRPTTNTLALVETGTEQQAYRFLETSVFVYVALALPRVLGGHGGLLLELVVVPVSLAATLSISVGLFFLLTRRKATSPRPFRAYLELTALYLGLNLPLTALWFVAATAHPAASLLLDVVVLVYFVALVRTWKRFLGLTAGRVFWYLIVSSAIAGAANTTFLAVVGALRVG